MFKTNDLYDLFTLGSGDSPGSETGALFAGTGSQVKILSKNKGSPNKEKSKRKSNNTSSCASLSSQRSCDPSNSDSFAKSSCDPSNNSGGLNESSCVPSKSSCDPSGSSNGGGKLKSLEEIRKAWQVELFGDASAKSKSSHSPGASRDADRTDHKSRKRKHSCACKLYCCRL